MVNLPNEFMRYVEPVTESGCWIWTAGCTGAGYGAYAPSHKEWILAHRFAYIFVNGPILKGLQLDHLCRVRCCVNPAHLEAVTCQDNILRGNGLAAELARRSHCKRGNHLLSGLNVYITPKGTRMCRLCHREAQQRWKSNQVYKNYGKQ